MDIIVPTLWLCDIFADTLAGYIENSEVNSIIVIDNNKSARPSSVSDLLHSNKLRIIEQNENIYVNAAWNLGVRIVEKRDGIIALVNDDIRMSSEVINDLERHTWREREVVGLLDSVDEEIIGNDLERRNLKSELIEVNYDKDRSIGQQYPGFGSMLVFRNGWYEPIPSSLRIWFGDDWILRSSRKILGLRTDSLQVRKHVSMQYMRRSEEFREILRSDKKAAQRLLGIVV